MKYWQVSIAVVALGILAIGSSNSFAASDPIYLNFPSISGDVVAKGFENQIQLDSFHWGVGRTISSPSGSGIREASAPSVSEITVTKLMDKASPLLLQNSLVGEAVSPVTITFVKDTGTGPIIYAEYTLDNVLISGYSVSSGGDNPTESLSLSFTKFTFKFTPTNPDGSLGTPIQTTYDLALGKIV